jgi:hypothetical protein
MNVPFTLRNKQPLTLAASPRSRVSPTPPLMLVVPNFLYDPCLRSPRWCVVDPAVVRRGLLGGRDTSKGVPGCCGEFWK